ncbi:hypothetical protein ABW20_dc0110272 [Dactylellina cionopaga]|nr:hypothetical protein ABW20_dc0110272 [Dactylellina cionopaga]
MNFLPIELQHQIICQLDPIGLISLSLCCRHFRNLISPRRKEQAEYLLALESDKRYGGGILICNTSSDGSVYPDWTLEAWEAQRWACTGCFRLLRHTDFDNHSLLGRAYRKLDPDSSAGRNLVTSWVPSLRGKKWGGEFRKARLREKKQAGLSDNTTTRSEEERCGYRRMKRRCNECLFKAGSLVPQFSRFGGYGGGTRKVPIRRSRLLTFESPLDRYFPRIADFLENKPPDFPPRVMRPIRWDTDYEPWTMYMVRCPGCEQWQELRSFRFGGCYVNWKQSHDGNGEIEYYTTLEGDSNKLQVDELRCNKCFAQERGRDALAQALWTWFKVPFLAHRYAIERRLPMPYSRFRDSAFKLPGFYKELRRTIRETESGKKPAFGCYNHLYVATLHLRHCRFRELWGRIQAAHPSLTAEMETNDEYFSMWLHYFPEQEAHWSWVAAAQKEIEENPSLLVDWALSQDPAALK